MKRICLLLALALPQWNTAATPRLKALILTGEIDSQYHDWRASTVFLRDLLERTGRFDVRVEEQVAGISADTLKPYDLLIVNYNGPRWGTAAEAAVEQFVRQGKGLISFHGVTYGPLYGMVFENGKWRTGGDQGWSAYADLIGARWDAAKIGHGKRHVFPVVWRDQEHAISHGLPASFVANDELYHRLELLPGTTVLAAAFDDASSGGTGRDEPIVWCRPFGSGRTVHLTLGHDLSALSQPGFTAAFARGAEWAATGTVTLPAVMPLPHDRTHPIRVLAVTGGHPYPTAFYSLFEGYTDITWSHAGDPAEGFSADLATHYDVIVLHDMREDLPAVARQNLQAFVEAGKGIVALHHAIVDYTAWPWWWQNVIGGKYFDNEAYDKAYPDHPKSAYIEDVDVVYNPTDLGANHPVTRGVGPLVLHDEVYRGMWHSPKIQVLMATTHENNDPPGVYIGPFEKARVVYIQPGHSESTMYNPAYKKLVRNAIVWAAMRDTP
jgi:type 1 glutamine amidotransferase